MAYWSSDFRPDFLRRISDKGLALKLHSVGTAQGAPKFLRYLSAKEPTNLKLDLLEPPTSVPLVNMGDAPSSGSSAFPSGAKRRLGTQKACDTCRSRKVKVR